MTSWFYMYEGRKKLRSSSNFIYYQLCEVDVLTKIMGNRQCVSFEISLKFCFFLVKIFRFVTEQIPATLVNLYMSMELATAQCACIVSCKGLI